MSLVSSAAVRWRSSAHHLSLGVGALRRPRVGGARKSCGIRPLGCGRESVEGEKEQESVAVWEMESKWLAGRRGGES